MADNTTINLMSGGDVIADEDIGGVKYQKVKLISGSVGTTTPIPGGANGLAIQGNVADDATTLPIPVIVGGVAVETDGTDPTSVSAEADIAQFRTDRNRRLLVNSAHPNLWSYNTVYGSAQTDAAVKATPGGNLSLYITDLIISNQGTAGSCFFEEDTAGAKTKMTATLYLAASGGAVVSFKTPLRVTANKDFGFTSVTMGTHSIQVLGYIAP